MQDQEIEWVRIVERKHTPLFVGFIVAGLRKDLIKEATQVEHDFRNFKKIDLDLYFDRTEMKSLTSKIMQKTKENGIDYLRQHADRCYSQCEKLLKTSREISAADRYKELSNRELAHLFFRYSGEAEKLGSYLTTVIACQNAFEPIFDENLRSALEKREKKDLFDEYKSALSIASKENLFVQNMKELISLASEIEKSEKLRNLFGLPDNEVIKKLPEIDPSFWKQMQSYVSQFGWMKPQYYRGEPYSEIDVILRLKTILTDDCTKKKHEMGQEKTQRNARLARIMAEMGSTDLTELVEIMRDYLHLRTYRLEVFFIANEYARQLLEEIARRLNATYDDIIFLTQTEILQSLEKDEAPKLTVMKGRKEGFAIIMIGGEVSIYEGPSYEKLAKKEAEAKTIKKIEGRVASIGRAQGSAKLVLVTDDIYNVNKGDIIVATMTTPNFIPAIEKCSAIVTDEGGILCHAAIVSREFGIPCIIGTGDATKKINNNDTIEVNASGEVGIVNIMRRR